jgi:hypothetical protein
MRKGGRGKMLKNEMNVRCQIVIFVVLTFDNANNKNTVFIGRKGKPSRVESGKG